MRELRALMRFLETRQKTDTGIILVSLLHTEGSTYQKPGARLLVSPTGAYSGLISGGCLEPDIVAHARNAWTEQKITTWTVDTRSEMEKWFGYGLGCKGKLLLVFEPFVFTNTEQMQLLYDLIDPERAVQQIIHVHQPNINTVSRAILKKGLWKIDTNFPAYDVNATTQVTQKPSANLASETPTIFHEFLPLPWALYIFTGSPDASPLATLCDQLGWTYHIITRDEKHAQALELWPGAASITTLNRQHPAENVTKTTNGYAVVMMHNFELDLSILESLTNVPTIKYIGLLGPEHRKAALLEAMAQHNAVILKSLLKKLHAPIGLPLGGRAPSEIALSIISEIQAVRYRSSQLKRKHQSVSVVILAAGASSRLGFPKQLIEFHGKTLLQHAIEKSRAVATHGVYIVLGAHAEKITPTLGETEILIYNQRWQTGLASSIQAGFRAAIPNPTQMPEHSVLFLLVDQPLLTQAHLEALVHEARHSQTDVVASEYMRQAWTHNKKPTAMGVPAIFASNRAPEIMSLTGHAGCKSIIEAIGVSNTAISTVTANALDFDIDYPEDLHKLTALITPDPVAQPKSS